MTLKRKLAQARAARRTEKNFASHTADVLEERVLLSATGVEPIGGTGNNVAHPSWGAAGNDLVRLTPAQYANGVNSPSLPQDASARVISNLVNSQADPANPSQNIATVNQQSMSDFVYAFGQFMDHDMDLTQGNGASDPISGSGTVSIFLGHAGLGQFLCLSDVRPIKISACADSSDF